MTQSRSSRQLADGIRLGSLAIGGAALAVGLVLMYLVKATGTLRVSEEGEIEGLDKHEHGSPAYHPEAAYMGGMISGMGSLTTSKPAGVPFSESVKS